MHFEELKIKNSGKLIEEEMLSRWRGSHKMNFEELQLSKILESENIKQSKITIAVGIGNETVKQLNVFMELDQGMAVTHSRKI